MENNKPCPHQIQVVSVSSENLIYVNTTAKGDEYNTVDVNSDSYIDVENINEVVIRKGYSPFINDKTGTWWEYDEKLRKYVDTGVAPGTNIPLASAENDGLMSKEDKIKLDSENFNHIDFTKITNFKPLRIGNQIFDGTNELVIPMYNGENNSDDNLEIEPDIYQMELIN